MRRSTRRRAVWACGAAVVCCLSLWLLTPVDRSLIDRALLVKPREDFICPAGAGSAGSALRLQGDWPYCWVTPDVLLTVQFSGSSISTLEPRLENLRTRRLLPVTHLKESVQGCWVDFGDANQPTHVDLSVAVQASPDGRWLLVSRPRPFPYPKYTAGALIRADDRRRVDWPPATEIASAVWARDSRRWVGLMRERGGAYGVGVFDIDRPNGTTERRLGVEGWANWDYPDGISPTLAGVLPDGRVLLIQWTEATGGQVRTARFYPDAEVEHPHIGLLPVPAGRSATPILPPVLSPAGDRIAWFLTLPRTPPGWPATRLFWAMLKTAPTRQAALWTTRTDGGDPREVGVYTQADPEDRPSLLQWTPDGRKLSFRYRGALYSIPAR